MQRHIVFLLKVSLMKYLYKKYFLVLACVRPGVNLIKSWLKWGGACYSSSGVNLATALLNTDKYMDFS